MLVGVVIGFGNPNVPSACEPDAFVPLFECAAGIDLVEFNCDSRIASIAGENRPAVIGRAIVQQDQFKILERLVQDAFYAFWQEARVAVIRDDYANFWHM